MARMPLYKTTETEMISRITKGDWEIGLRLPNEFELADEFGVSQGTMRRALISLEGMGYLNRKPGRGTLVAANAPKTDIITSVSPCLVDGNGAPLALEPFRARRGTRAATPFEADLLGTARLIYLERTLKFDGARAAIEETILADSALPELSEDAPVALDAFLSAHGLTPARIEAEASAEITDMGQSVALSSDRHTPLLCVRSAAFDAAGAAIAFQVLKLAVPGASLVHR